MAPSHIIDCILQSKLVVRGIRKFASNNSYTKRYCEECEKEIPPEKRLGTRFCSKKCYLRQRDRNNHDKRLASANKYRRNNSEKSATSYYNAKELERKMFSKSLSV